MQNRTKIQNCNVCRANSFLKQHVSQTQQQNTHSSKLFGMDWYIYNEHHAYALVGMLCCCALFITKAQKLHTTIPWKKKWTHTVQMPSREDVLVGLVYTNCDNTKNRTLDNNTSTTTYKCMSATQHEIIHASAVETKPLHCRG